MKTLKKYYVSFNPRYSGGDETRLSLHERVENSRKSIELACVELFPDNWVLLLNRESLGCKECKPLFDYEIEELLDKQIDYKEQFFFIYKFIVGNKKNIDFYVDCDPYYVEKHQSYKDKEPQLLIKMMENFVKKNEKRRKEEINIPENEYGLEILFNSGAKSLESYKNYLLKEFKKSKIKNVGEFDYLHYIGNNEYLLNYDVVKSIIIRTNDDLKSILEKVVDIHNKNFFKDEYKQKCKHIWVLLEEFKNNKFFVETAGNVIVPSYDYINGIDSYVGDTLTVNNIKLKRVSHKPIEKWDKNHCRIFQLKLDNKKVVTKTINCLGNFYLEFINTLDNAYKKTEEK